MLAGEFLMHQGNPGSGLSYTSQPEGLGRLSLSTAERLVGYTPLRESPVWLREETIFVILFYPASTFLRR